jgi:HEAT repeat protein
MKPGTVHRLAWLVGLAALGAAAGCSPWYSRWGIEDEKELHSFGSIGKLNRALEAGNCYDRLQAGEVVFELGDKARSAVFALEKALVDRKCNFRQRTPAARALGRLGEPAFPILQKNLDSKHGDLRSLAVLGFGEMQSNQSVVVGLLTRKLSSSDPLDQEGARAEAFYALGKLGPAAIPAIPDLVSLLADEQWRLAAMDTLLAIGHPSRQALTALKKLADESPDPDFKAQVMQRYDGLMAKAKP